MSCVIGDYTFRLGPDTVSLPYQVNTAETPTVGGKVVQVLGVKYGDLVVSGSFGSWEEQHGFLETMKEYGSAQANILDPPDPFRFLYPARNWDFMVFINKVATVGSSRSVRWANDELAPVWRLVLFIEQDNGELTKVATDAFIERLAEGVGWQRTKFSSPMEPWDENMARQEQYGDAALNSRPDHL